ncbi:MAG: GNAT family N-acetyltransferase [Acidimicrobiia bacterium]|nr:GNAT family N-acetyltransferase [Acidimicrobiia bacterium]
MRVEPCSEPSPCWRRLVAVAAEVEQEEWLLADHETAFDETVLGAFAGEEVIGFLRSVVQVAGADRGVPAVTIGGREMLETIVLAYGVLPGWRRRGVGRLLLRRATDQAVDDGSHQIRAHPRGGDAVDHQLRMAIESGGRRARRGADGGGVYYLLPPPTPPTRRRFRRRS